MRATVLSFEREGMDGEGGRFTSTGWNPSNCYIFGGSIDSMLRLQWSPLHGAAHGPESTPARSVRLPRVVGRVQRRCRLRRGLRGCRQDRADRPLGRSRQGAPPQLGDRRRCTDEQGAGRAAQQDHRARRVPHRRQLPRLSHQAGRGRRDPALAGQGRGSARPHRRRRSINDQGRVQHRAAAQVQAPPVRRRPRAASPDQRRHLARVQGRAQVHDD
jgi:hypothetical protein